MMTNLTPPQYHFNVKDIFRAPRLAFNAKKVWLMTRFLAAALLFYNLLVYGYGAIQGRDLSELWFTSHFFPLPNGLIITMLALTGTIAILLFAMTGVAKITAEQLRGDDFYPANNAMRYAFNNWYRIILPPAALFVMAGGLIGIAVLFGLLRNIPLIGQIILAILLVPGYFYGLFIALLVVVGIISLLYTGAVISLTDGDVFDALFDYFWMIIYESGRMVAHLAVSILLAGLAMLIFGGISGLIIGIGMIIDGHTADVIQQTAAYLPFHDYFWEIHHYPLSGTDPITVLIMGVGLTFIGLIVAAYGLTTFTIAATLTFNGVHYRREKQNLLKWKLRDDEPEEIKTE